MRMYEIIEAKRNKRELTKPQIDFFVSGVANSTLPDYQISALLMAICINGMTDEETKNLTIAMANSGDIVDLSRFGNDSADKHSTGGVGDKTSLIAAPLAAAMGVKVAKMSGKGLGITGGTSDKLSAIPGYNINVSPGEFLKQVQNIGLAIVYGSGNLTPADKKLYALRDVTATVDSIPLIASSIMSKKIASGAKNIVLDIKCGCGGFMKELSSAKLLADKMIAIGKAAGKNVSAFITDMNEPLGNEIGNTLEIKECVKILRGEEYGKLGELSLKLAAKMVSCAKNISFVKACNLADDTLKDGKAYEKFIEWIKYQGGDVRYIENTDRFEKAKHILLIKARENGYVNKLFANEFGLAASLLGAGRKTKDDVIDYCAGITLHKHIGDEVHTGDVICELKTNNKDALKSAAEVVEAAISYSSKKPEDRPIIIESID